MASATKVPNDSYGLDTSLPLNAAQQLQLAKTPLPGTKSFPEMQGKYPIFLWQYLPRAGMGLGAISAERAASAVAAGLILLLVQYGPPKAGFIVTGPGGDLDGKMAVAAAQAAGYPVGCHLAVDLEGLGSVGQPVVDYLSEWCAAVHAAGYLTCAYVGYAPGLNPTQFAAMTCIDLFWSDAAYRVPPTGIGFSVKQDWTIKLNGIPFDPDHAVLDMKGRGLIGMGPDMNVETVDGAAGTT